MKIFLFYQYENYYILIEIFQGTCSECIINTKKKHNYSNIIRKKIDRAYVSTNFEEITEYFNKQLGWKWNSEYNEYYAINTFDRVVDPRLKT